MPRCPECGKEISYLLVERVEGGMAELDEEGELEYEWADDYYGDEAVGLRYICPECGKVLFEDEYDAEAFLRGEDE
jgi:DNA-directed RNA polymerase subunit RPC12/RpoP